MNFVVPSPCETEPYNNVSYGPSLFPLIYGPSAKRAGINKIQGSVTYSTDRENEVSKIFIISLRARNNFGRVSGHDDRPNSF